MSDLKLFRIERGTAIELEGLALALQKPLQALIERNMEVLFGVRFVASEHSTGKKHGGRIDSLGIDENGSPSSSSTSAQSTRTSSTKACSTLTGSLTTAPSLSSW